MCLNLAFSNYIILLYDFFLFMLSIFQIQSSILSSKLTNYKFKSFNLKKLANGFKKAIIIFLGPNNWNGFRFMSLF